MPIKEVNYRSFVGKNYDLVSAMEFNLLTFLGLREYHYLLDIGCGSLRAGKLFIPYLLPNHYYGIEPEKWLINDGLKYELGKEILLVKKPNFSNNSNFILSIFNKRFDFLLAQSIFTHASQNQIKVCLKEAKKVMNPNSIFALTFIEGKKNNERNEWIYPNTITYTHKRMKKLVNEVGLILKPFFWKHTSNHSWFLIMRPENSIRIKKLRDLSKLYFKYRLKKIKCLIRI